MKEDVLEQVVDDYLQFNGYFTQHNIRFRPDPAHPNYVADHDRVPSDVDVVGLHPGRDGIERVWVVTCKSWQQGFNPRRKLEELRGVASNPKKKETWRHFRELWIPKWADALKAKVDRLTGQQQFVYHIAVTRLVGEKVEEWTSQWSGDSTIAQNLPGCSVRFITIETMWQTMIRELTKTPASSEIGRLAQLLRAAGLTGPKVIEKPLPAAAGSEAAAEDEAEEQDPR